MSNHSEDSDSSLEDSDDLDDIPLSIAPNGRYEHDDPPMTSRGPHPGGFSRLGAGFPLKLPIPKPEESDPAGPDGIQGMRSEPAYLPETSRVRPPPGLFLAMGPTRVGSVSYNSATDESGPMLTRRGPLKPPMLSLVNPASASPVPSGAPTPGVEDAGVPSQSRAQAWPLAAEQQQQPHRRQQPVRVDLISPAFVLQGLSAGGAAGPHDGASGTGVSSSGSGGTSTSDRIIQRCSSQLGVAASDLEFVELRPLESGPIPESCTRLGVVIRGSSFSLSALEDMLACHKRDGQLATMLEGALRESSQHAAEARALAERAAKQSEELAVLRERLRGAEAANQHLREQLQRSDEHRQLLGGTLRTIKKEFEDFKGRVVVEGTAVSAAALCASAALEPPLQLPALQQLSLGPVAAAGGGCGGGSVACSSAGPGGGSGPTAATAAPPPPQDAVAPLPSSSAPPPMEGLPPGGSNSSTTTMLKTAAVTGGGTRR